MMSEEGGAEDELRRERSDFPQLLGGDMERLALSVSSSDEQPGKWYFVVELHDDRNRWITRYELFAPLGGPQSPVDDLVASLRLWAAWGGPGMGAELAGAGWAVSERATPQSHRGG
jgi:hypothetical protein